MGTDVKSVRLTATGVAFPMRTRVRAVYLTGTAGAGTLTLRDGPGGDILLQLDTQANGDKDVDIPGDGLLFQNTVDATLSGLTSAVIFYG
jgi:hypothetical protein